MQLTTAQTDRAVGVLLASAAGDALGAGYEFGSATPPVDGSPQMIGGGLGGFAPGEWTDDTAQAFAIAEVAATGADLRSPAALDAIAQRFADWFAEGPADVGIQTAQVLGAAGAVTTAARMRAAADAVHERSGRSAGNGSLMRTAPVALAHLDDPAALVEAAVAVSALTHHDPLAGEAAALWCLLVRHAVLTGTFVGARGELRHLPPVAAERWSAWLDEAEREQPGTFTTNGWAVGALQAAWSAIHHTPVPAHAPERLELPCLHLQHALETAVRIGHDTDTVAAIAGALLGARWGASAVPWRWRRLLHGWPGPTTAGPSDARRLVELATLTVRRGVADATGWPLVEEVTYAQRAAARATAYPFDPDVLLGTHATRGHGASAVVAACRVGRSQPSAAGAEVVVESRLVDHDDPAENPHLHFALLDAADAVRGLRAEGHRVLLHCVAAQQRTPSIALALARLEGVDADLARDAVRSALPDARARGALWDAAAELGPAPGSTRVAS
ncbi:ADP-ribosylglycohydrolase family protein [Nocardioides zeae]|uniref:ADP-ribosylglycohydrolase family protein n=1 Tax=Nocardioides imazamoxiresistens TaxID=3231893 RepID=A0ABU3PWS7_9ACTN|nr:ADP-ribosylglycohydrolase family protein [Nocardioides zeae]MDT9593693.1 ADP-ribosylglycohydrolase family protein [Nocardioides zeae]